MHYPDRLQRPHPCWRTCCIKNVHFQSQTFSSTYIYLSYPMRRIIKDKRSIGKFSIRTLQASLQPSVSPSKPTPSEAFKRRDKQEVIGLQTLLPEKLCQSPLPLIHLQGDKCKPYLKIEKNPEKLIILPHKWNEHDKRYSVEKLKDSSKTMQAKFGRIYNPCARSSSFGKIKHQFDSPNRMKSLTNRKHTEAVPIKEYEYELSQSVRETPKIMDYPLQVGLDAIQEERMLPPCSCDENPSIKIFKAKQKQLILQDDGSKMTIRYQQQQSPQQWENLPLVRPPVDVLSDYSKPQANELQVGFGTKISELKHILIQESGHLNFTFPVPKKILSSIRKTITQAEIHRAAYEIFARMLGFHPQLAALKRLANCIMLMAQSPSGKDLIALIWYYNGSFYLGSWNSQKQAEGKSEIGFEYTSQQRVYYGQFAQNQRNGYGIMKQSSGECYVGEWRDGHRCGWGKGFDRSGIIVADGNFQADRLTSKP